MIRLLAGFMTLAAGSAWLLISRWERPGAHAERRVALHPPRLVRHGFELALLAQLVYPMSVAVAPDETYEGPANWSSTIDVPLQAAGLLLWVLGITVLLRASWVMRRYLAVDGLAIGQELVTHGPYRYVRHPVYAAFMAIALGTALVFRSYLLLGLSVVMILTGLWWARAEEGLLASTKDLGDAYRAYAARTGRFLPSRRRLRA